MGKSNKSKKSVETQSPMLKIFKDIMQKEKGDQQTKDESTKEKRKKRKKLSAYPKSTQGKHEISDSSAGKQVQPPKYIVAEGSRMAKDRHYREDSSQGQRSHPIHHEKRESWWLWGGNYNTPKQPSTCTCVSCQLRKMLTNEYACVAILVVIFCASLLIAWYLINNTAYGGGASNPACPAKTRTDVDLGNHFEDIHMPSSTNDYKHLDIGRNARKSVWDDSVSNNGDAAFSGYDFADTGMHADSSAQDMQLFSQRSSFLDPQNLKDDSISPQMKSFYKKLIETDAQIKNLKKGLYNPSSKNSMYRLKRSLFRNKAAKAKAKSAKIKAIKNELAKEAKDLDADRKAIEGNVEEKIKRKKHNKKTTTNIEAPSKRVRRFENGSIVPEGYIFQKKEIMIKYLMNPRHTPKFPKCSHVQRSESDEQNHPYNKNSGRVDQLLGKFLQGTASEPVDMTEEYHSPLPDKSSSRPRISHFPEASPNNEYSTSASNSDFTQLKHFRNPNSESVAVKKNYKVNDPREDAEKKEYNDDMWDTEWYNDPINPGVRVLQPASINSNPKQRFQNIEKRKKSVLNSQLPGKDEKNEQVEKVFKIPSRKLQQLDEQEEEEEGIGYEDFKEVLSDESDGHDEFDRQVDRNRRDNGQENGDTWKQLPPPITHNPSAVFNKNWKGPVPLYPDEMNSMISATLKTASPITKSVMGNWPVTLKVDPISSYAKELDYLLNNMRNKYEENIANLAQAYSDYGVLSENIHNPKIESSSNAPSPTTLQHIGFDDDEIMKPDTKDEADEVLDVTATAVRKYPFHVVSNKNNFNKTNKKRNVRLRREDFTTPTSIEKVNDIVDLKNNNEKAEIDIVTKAVNEFSNDVKGLEKSNNGQVEKRSDRDMGTGEFLRLISNWFSSLAFMSEKTGNLTTARVANISNPTTPLTTTTKEKETKESFPIYDSDMVDNIGHRSRVLMSIEDRTNVADSDNSSEENNSTSDKRVASETSYPFIETDKTPAALQSSSTTSYGLMMSNNSNDTNNMLNKNETKRSVRDEEDFVFWNDMYDDEYGITMAPISERENGDQTKGTAGVMKKSADWIQSKMRQMSDTIRKTSKEGKSKLEDRKRDSRDTEGSNINDFLKYVSLNGLMHKLTKRDSGTGDSKVKRDISPQDYGKHKNNFAVMTAHMKEVCKQAAEAVQKTRSIKPREDHESDMARGLMQNLVKLMSDLVDFEVQQRTCLSLPSDLKDFLDWLTNPAPVPKNFKMGYPTQTDIAADQLIDIATTQSSEREDIRTDARSECLGTLLAVQDLMMDYSKLSDEDKSKVFGVKEYLEDQLDFLNKQIGNSDEINSIASAYSKEFLPVRKRRELLKNPEFLRRRQYRHLSRNKRRFLKNYSKKHTKSTANNFESAHVSTETVKRITDHDPKVVEAVEDDTKEKKKREDAIKEDKRSLPEVYYRALESARKAMSSEPPNKAEIVTIAKNNK